MHDPLKYKLLAAKGSVSDCNMTRACSIFASLAFQLFLSRQVHTAQEYLSNSNPADQGTEANTCSSVFGLWGRYFPQYVDLARTPALSESKTSSHNTGIPQLLQPSTNQKQTLACLFLEFEVDIYEDRCLFSWPFSQPQCLLRRSHQSWGKRYMISLFFVLFAANYIGP